MMIEVRVDGIQSDPQGGKQLTLFWLFDWVCDATPFRAMLSETTDAIAQDPKSNLQSTAYEANQDFVEGSIRFGEVSLRIYYEHSLSYLTSTSKNEAPVRKVARRIRSSLTIVQSTRFTGSRLY